jgi:hypothetical protein
MNILKIALLQERITSGALPAATYLVQSRGGSTSCRT